jgi:uncharacterized protein (DUF924 family)
VSSSAVTHQDILAFWFEETPPKKRWVSDPEFDTHVRARFAGVLDQAQRGELFGWRTQPRGRLAEVIVLDQFSRNIHRNTPKAFAQDPMALALAQEALAAGAEKVLPQLERSFLLMPFMHSESRLIHEWAEKLFRENGPEDSYRFELKHKATIDRFGRYPHRNEILGRVSSAEEVEFLGQPGANF